MALLGAAVPAIEWAGWCALTLNKQLIWEERGNELNKAILHLMNLKNKNAKRDLRLAYFQRNSLSFKYHIYNDFVINY